MEVGGRRGEPDLELVHAAAVVEVHGDHLGRHDRGQVVRLLGLHTAAVSGDEFVTLDGDLDGGAVEEDAAVLGHGRAPGYG